MQAEGGKSLAAVLFDHRLGVFEQRGAVTTFGYNLG
jgi:hypothetical protein